MIKFFFIISLLFPLENQVFKIKFLGLPTAKVALNARDTLYHGQMNKYIHFTTESMGVFDYLFHVDNQYYTIVSDDIKNIMSFGKNTRQPNVENTLETSIIKNQTIYNNSSIIIPKNYFNIFSLLYFLSHNKISDNHIVNIEREGIFYTGVITRIDELVGKNQILYNLDLRIQESSNNIPIIEHTDIFTWALFQDNAKREILIDYDANKIVKCQFSKGGIRMIARNIRY